jgi:hypothetical protein
MGLPVHAWYMDLPIHARLIGSLFSGEVWRPDMAMYGMLQLHVLGV